MRGLLLLGLLVSVSATAGTTVVTARESIGPMVEDVAHVGAGRYAGQVAFLDGHAVKVADPTTGAVAVLFDVFTKAGLHWVPRGIGFIDATREFVLTDFENGAFVLAYTDESGTPTRRLSAASVLGYVPAHLEAIEYLPPSAGSFGGNVGMLAFDSSFAPEIAIFTPAGARVSGIKLAPEAATSAWGFTYAGTDQFFVTASTSVQAVGAFARTDRLVTVDLAGNVLATSGALAGVSHTEGLARLGDGTLVVAEYRAGRLDLLDASNFDWQRSIQASQASGISCVYSIAYDPASNGYYFNNAFGQVISTDRALGSRTTQFDFLATPSPITGSSAVLLDLVAPRFANVRFDKATSKKHLLEYEPRTSATTPVSRIVLDDALGGQVRGWVKRVVYLPASAAYAVRFDASRFPADAATVHIIGRDGRLRASLDFGAKGYARVDGVTYVYPSRRSRDPLLLVAADDKLLVSDMNGQILEVYDQPAERISLFAHDPSAGTRSFVGMVDESTFVRFDLVP